MRLQVRTPERGRNPCFGYSVANDQAATIYTRAKTVSLFLRSEQRASSLEGRGRNDVLCLGVQRPRQSEHGPSFAARRATGRVRLVLGTTPLRLRLRFVRDGLAPVVFGIFSGIVCGAGAGKLLGSQIEGANGSDFQTYTLAAISICLVSTASIWLATRRIARMDVAEILRAE